MISDKGFGLLVNETVYFRNDTTVRHEFVKVMCYNKESVVYTGYFSFILPKSHLLAKNGNETRNKINILLVGHDSISHNTFIRAFPKLKSELLKLNAIELQAYTKVAENTFPNMLAMLLGKSVDEIKQEGWNSSQKFDRFDFLWEKFKRNGYTTSWAEDAYVNGTFNYQNQGFKDIQTDYYLRPFVEAYTSDDSVWSTGDCVEDKYEISVLLDYIADFLNVYQNQPYFALTFNARVTHDTIKYTNMLEEPNLQFLRKIKKTNLNNTAIFYFSDHGQRIAEIRDTKPGRLEDKLPSMYIILPPSFQQQHPEMVDNLRENAFKLTSTWDINKTLLHLLRLSGSNEDFHDKIDRGISLLEKIPFERSCKDAGVIQSYCPCGAHSKIETSNPIIQKGAHLAVRVLNNKLHEEARGLCQNHSLVEVKEAYILPQTGNTKLYPITIRTDPGDNVFDATILYTGIEISVTDLPLRANFFGNRSFCVKDVVLKTLCVCKGWQQ